LRLGHQVRGAVQRAIDDRLDRLRRRQTALPAADAADRSAALRRRADLLLAAPGALVVDGIVGVADVYGDGTPVQLQVDPTLDLAANAQKLYRRAQRIEAQAERAGAARARSEAQAADFDQLAQATRAMRTPAEIESVIEAALKAGLKLPLERLRIAEAGTGHLLNELAPKTTVPGGGILHVTTSEGYEILIGRNAINNDRLTHKVADRHDWWLHAEGPGSHVVLRNPRRLEQPPPDALVAAAALAAWFSKARSAAKVEVRWTQARRVRKPRGAPAGTALLDKFHSFVVAPRPPAEVAAETAPRRS